MSSILHSQNAERKGGGVDPGGRTRQLPENMSTSPSKYVPANEGDWSVPKLMMVAVVVLGGFFTFIWFAST